VALTVHDVSDPFTLVYRENHLAHACEPLAEQLPELVALQETYEVGI
jgi:hypothetical protein